jgi:hypothetical protein
VAVFARVEVTRHASSREFVFLEHLPLRILCLADAREKRKKKKDFMFGFGPLFPFDPAGGRAGARALFSKTKS